LKLVIFSVIAAIFSLINPLREVFARYSLNFQDGWNSYYSSIAASGAPLYENPMAYPNYPPLSYYIIGNLGAFFGNIVSTGRMISLFSVAFISVGVFFILRRHSKSFRVSFLGLLWTLSLLGIFAPDYIAMNHPQFLAHAVMMGSMLFYIHFRASEKPCLRILVVAAILAVTALFIKHNLLAFPFAVSLDLLLHSRRRLVVWCVSFFGVGAAALFILNYQTEGRLIEALLAKRQYDLEGMFHRLRFSILVLAIPLLCSFKTAKETLRDSKWRWLSIYFFCSLGLGIAAFSGAGIDVNLMFDFVIAASILITLASANPSSKYVLPAIIILLSVGSVLRLSTMPSRSEIKTKEALYERDVEIIRSIPGPAICEDLLICFWAGKPLQFETFLIKQSIVTKKIDETLVLETLRNRKWAVVQVNRPEAPNRFTENFLQTLRAEYKLHDSRDRGPRIFYIHR